MTAAGDAAVLSGVTVAQLYVRALRRFRERVAASDSMESVTYGGLEARAAAYAAGFREAGLRRGDGVAQLSANRIDAVAVIIAAFASGLRYTPLHPRGAEADHLEVLRDSEVRALVIDERAFPHAAERLGGALDPTLLRFSFGEHRGCRALRPQASAGQTARLVVTSEPEDIACIFYTGGTTGRSKGVVHRHRSIVANTLIELAEFEWPDPLRCGLVTPISHAGFAFLLPVLLRGGELILRDGFKPAEFLADVAAQRVTATFLVPTMIAALLDAPEIESSDTSSLQMIVYGAAPIAPARLEQALRRFGPVFVQLFGQTEAPNVITVLRKADHSPDHPERLASCGVPVVGLDVLLLDDEGREVATGEVGEICVRGPLVMEGYWKRPEETHAALAGSWLHTGDLARADEAGYLTIVDRKKDLIISGGFNVYPREVEDVLAAHPQVSQVIVVGVPDAKWGEAVMAYVVATAGERPSVEELAAFVKARKGAVYAPKAIEFVDQLPVTPLGKPDRKTLRARHWSGRERQVN